MKSYAFQLPSLKKEGQGWLCFYMLYITQYRINTTPTPSSERRGMKLLKFYCCKFNLETVWCSDGMPDFQLKK